MKTVLRDSNPEAAGQDGTNPWADSASTTTTTQSGPSSGAQTQTTQQATPTGGQQQPTAPAPAQGATQQQQGVPTSSPQPQHVAPASLTPQQIAEIAAQAAARVNPQTQQAAPRPQLTQEEYDRTFNVTKVDAKRFEAIIGYAPEKPEQVAAFNSYGQEIARQALTMANALFEHKLAELKSEFQGQINPMQTLHRQQFERQLESDFLTFAPDLKDYRSLYEMVGKTTAADIKAGTMPQFDTKDALFKFVADKTRSLLPASVLQTTNGASPQGGTPQTQQTTQRRMTTASTGGQVSAGTSSATKQNDAQTIFG